MKFNQLKKNLKKDFTGLPELKLAMVADSASQLYTQTLRGIGYDYGFNLNVWEADYDQVDRQIQDPTSDLNSDEHEFVIIFESAQKLQEKYFKLPADERYAFAEQEISRIKGNLAALTQTPSTKVLYINYEELNDSVFGNYAGKISSSFHYQVKKINLEIANNALQIENLFIVDLASHFSMYGERFIRDQKIYISTDIIFSLDYLPIIAESTIQIIAAIKGKFKKCLILDLDNTTWGGIIGDDGMENIEIGSLGIGKAFTGLQKWAKQLKERGIILCICSKNTESIAKEPFESHPDMQLRLDDISVFVANWENKVDNIRHIQNILNIGFDSMVFLDDNPFERNIVRENIPDITVPELPEDPAEYLSFVRSLNLFETASFSSTDKDRTKQYQEQAKRTTYQSDFTSTEDFLASLRMKSEVKPFDKFTTPRVAQLTQRSNQFNLRTIRYSEADVKGMIASDDVITCSFTLDDKFGEYGLISLAILKKDNDHDAFIDTWIMSCRVLKRNVEEFVLNHLVELAKNGNYARLVAEYLPTKKNVIVKDLYEELGFTKEQDTWVLNLDSYEEKPTYINVN